MAQRYYRTPPQPASNRVRCPVCREAVYSRAGIHPQCAVRQSEPPRPKTPPRGEIGPGDPAKVAVGVPDIAVVDLDRPAV